MRTAVGLLVLWNTLGLRLSLSLNGVLNGMEQRRRNPRPGVDNGILSEELFAGADHSAGPSFPNKIITPVPRKFISNTTATWDVREESECGTTASQHTARRSNAINLAGRQKNRQDNKVWSKAWVEQAIPLRKYLASEDLFAGGDYSAGPSFPKLNNSVMTLLRERLADLISQHNRVR
ncbi:hypothetical protein C8R45DRAFT_945063 [Mycena sanguinolenta]|nr:hypothetical protein C8R45DRAFT_945063 [Mycena sanguinolenta]